MYIHFSSLTDMEIKPAGIILALTTSVWLWFPML